MREGQSSPSSCGHFVDFHSELAYWSSTYPVCSEGMGCFGYFWHKSGWISESERLRAETAKWPHIRDGSLSPDLSAERSEDSIRGRWPGKWGFGRCRGRWTVPTACSSGSAPGPPRWSRASARWTEDEGSARARRSSRPSRLPRRRRSQAAVDVYGKRSPCLGTDRPGCYMIRRRPDTCCLGCTGCSRRCRPIGRNRMRTCQPLAGSGFLWGSVLACL